MIKWTKTKYLNMKKLLTHWTFDVLTLFIVTYIGLKDEPQIKEVLRLKSFDLLLQSGQKKFHKM